MQDEQLKTLLKEGIHSAIDKPLQLKELLNAIQNA
jgi:hypothetical protein